MDKFLEKQDFFKLHGGLVKMYKKIGASENIFYYYIISLERTIASELGNHGRFDESDALAEENLFKCFKYDRLDVVTGFLYCLAWNNHKDERKKTKDKQMELRASFALADLMGKTDLKKKIINQCQIYYSEDVLDKIN